mmetsp:Transcript_65483/g.144898  ORF Transcript_65483/g.144898 Transcript_65483/m.144898 type:complete len:261 (+) Transcript_65483:515-1297(+)
MASCSAIPRWAVATCSIAARSWKTSRERLSTSSMQRAFWAKVCAICSIVASDATSSIGSPAGASSPRAVELLLAFTTPGAWPWEPSAPPPLSLSPHPAVACISPGGSSSTSGKHPVLSPAGESNPFGECATAAEEDEAASVADPATMPLSALPSPSVSPLASSTPPGWVPVASAIAGASSELPVASAGAASVETVVVAATADVTAATARTAPATPPKVMTAAPVAAPAAPQAPPAVMESFAWPQASCNQATRPRSPGACT